MRIIDVVNDMLGTMGEAPLNSLNDSHNMKGAAQRILARFNKNIQAEGWWYNREKFTALPELNTGKIYLPSDTIGVRGDFIQRGRVLYDPAKGTDVFTQPQTFQLLRLVPFEDLPEIAAAYIAAAAVLRFQSDYDGDSTKTRELTLLAMAAKTEAKAEETRQVRGNLIWANPKLMEIKATAHRLRPGRRLPMR
jgi:hypothetical protein